MDEDNYEPHHSKTPFELLELADGELPSIGSEMHATGECKRCAFFSKGRCQNGKECSHCHFPHDERRRRKNRRAKGGNKENMSEANVDEADASDLILDQGKGVQDKLSLPNNKPMEEGKAVSLPPKVQANQFDSTIVFGTITPEEQVALKMTMSTQEETRDMSRSKATIEEACDISRSNEGAAFSSIFGNGKPSPVNSEVEVSCRVEGTKDVELTTGRLIKEIDKETCNSQASIITPASSVKSPDLAKLEQAMLEAEEEAARLEAAAAAAELEVQQTVKESVFVSRESVFVSLEKDGPPLEVELETTTDSEANIRELAESASASESDCSNLLRTTSFGNASQENSEQTLQKPGRRLHSPLWPNRAPLEDDDSPSPSDEHAKKSKVPAKSWAAHAQEKRKQSTSNENGPEEDAGAVARRARGILNKLTDKNFDTLYEQLLGCGIHTQVQLEAVVREIFEKATTQHIFLRMYVDLAEKMDQHFKKNPIEGCDFRKILVGACQQTFDRNLKEAVPIDINMTYEEQYEAQLKFRTRMLGNLRFVGELLV